MVGSIGFICAVVGSSPSTRRRNTREAHLCPRWYFSLHVKHSPHSRREAISSGVSRLMVEGGRGRVGRRGRGLGGEDERAGMEGRGDVVVDM